MFAALIIMAIVTALQAERIGRLGAGHMVVTGITPDYIALAVLALADGDPELPASLMVVSPSSTWRWLRGCRSCAAV